MTDRVRVRVSRILDKQTNDGKAYFSQAVNISQFPREDVTIWHTFTDKKYAYPEGVHTCVRYQVDESWTDKATGKPRSTIKTKFYDFQPYEG